jgi:hypothetical protein
MRHLLLAVLLVAMTGCGPDTTPEDQSAAPAETPNGSDEPSAEPAKAVVSIVNSIGTLDPRKRPCHHGMWDTVVPAAVSS